MILNLVVFFREGCFWKKKPILPISSRPPHKALCVFHFILCPILCWRDISCSKERRLFFHRCFRRVFACQKRMNAGTLFSRKRKICSKRLQFHSTRQLWKWWSKSWVRPMACLRGYRTPDPVSQGISFDLRINLPALPPALLWRKLLPTAALFCPGRRTGSCVSAQESSYLRECLAFYLSSWWEQTDYELWRSSALCDLFSRGSSRAADWDKTIPESIYRGFSIFSRMILFHGRGYTSYQRDSSNLRWNWFLTEF